MRRKFLVAIILIMLLLVTWMFAFKKVPTKDSTNLATKGQIIKLFNDNYPIFSEIAGQVVGQKGYFNVQYNDNGKLSIGTDIESINKADKVTHKKLESNVRIIMDTLKFDSIVKDKADSLGTLDFQKRTTDGSRGIIFSKEKPNSDSMCRLLKDNWYYYEMLSTVC